MHTIKKKEKKKQCCNKNKDSQSKFYRKILFQSFCFKISCLQNIILTCHFFVVNCEFYYQYLTLFPHQLFFNVCQNVMLISLHYIIFNYINYTNPILKTMYNSKQQNLTQKKSEWILLSVILHLYPKTIVKYYIISYFYLNSHFFTIKMGVFC